MTVDVGANRLDMDVPPGVLEQRKAEWTAPKPRYSVGVFAKYCQLVSSASEGATTSGV
ncbi:dihydroxy-acid dehydratase [compost metagenome]